MVLNSIRHGPMAITPKTVYFPAALEREVVVSKPPKVVVHFSPR